MFINLQKLSQILPNLSKPILLNIDNTIFKIKDYIAQMFPFLFTVEASRPIGLKNIDK